MGDKTKISWTDATWNPVRGCSRVSPGCQHCYAEAVASRFSGPGMPYEGLAADRKWTGKVRLVPDHLADPLRWKRPRRIFVNSMSDLFHEGLKDEEIDRVFAVMCIGNAFPQHTFQILTKRPEEMRAYMSDPQTPYRIHSQLVHDISFPGYYPSEGGCDWKAVPWPPPRIWLGVSVERQEEADTRIPLLLQTPAAVRFVSAEPLLGPVSLDAHLRCPECGYTKLDIGMMMDHYICKGPGPRLDWIIVGGESGPKARPFHVRWADRILEDCAAAGIPCFMKQLGADPRWAGAKSDPIEHASGKNDDPTAWPASLRVQQFPGA